MPTAEAPTGQKVDDDVDDGHDAINRAQDDLSNAMIDSCQSAADGTEDGFELLVSSVSSTSGEVSYARSGQFPDPRDHSCR
jgi:hypothetical protein